MKITSEKFYILIIVFSCSLSLQAQNNIELVESIPVETNLDNPDIRNTTEVWLEMINSAQKTIDIEQFYISNQKGEPLDTILSAIVTAAKRGVVVRIIIDSKMYQTYPDDVHWLEEQSPNITKHVIDFDRLAGGVQHAKFFIIDDTEVFLGSQNFDWRALKHIHELGIRFKGTDAIQIYRGLFNADWQYAEIDDGKSWHCPIFTISKNYHMDSDIYGKYIRLMPTTSPVEFNHINSYEDLEVIKQIIGLANNEINLQFLSYNPTTKDGYWDEVDGLLIDASKRGVKVRLLVSDWNLSRVAVYHFQSLIAYPNIEVRYTAIPEYSGGFIPYARVGHCKFITADSTTWIGTSNMSRSYFYESRNVGMGIENAKFTERVRRIFFKSWDSEYAVPITPLGTYEMRKRDW